MFTGTMKALARAGQACGRFCKQAVRSDFMSSGMAVSCRVAAQTVVVLAVAAGVAAVLGVMQDAHAAGMFGSAGDDTRLFDDIKGLGESTHTELAGLVRYGALIGLTVGGLVYALIPPARRYATQFFSGAVVGILVAVFAEPLVSFLGVQ